MLRDVRRTVGAMLAGLLVLCGAAQAAAETYGIVATNAAFQSRRSFGGGLYDATANKTFIAYNGAGMDIYVQAYDHATNAWGAPTKIYDWDDYTQYAYHDYTTLVMLPDGRLGIFAFDHSNNAHMLKAPTAHSITGAWSHVIINTDLNDYPMPVVAGSTVYLFYSRNDDIAWPYRTYRLIKSTDSGATWSAPVTVIDPGKTADRMNEVYAMSGKLLNNRIYMTYILAGGAAHNDSSKNLYLAYFDPATNKMYSATGVDLGATITSGEIASTLVRAISPPASGTSDQKHPITYSDVSRADNGTLFVAFGETTLTTKSILWGKLSAGSWSFGTVASGTAEFNDLTRPGPDDFEVLYTDDTSTTITNKLVQDLGTGPTTTLYSLPITYGGTNADRVIMTNFIENRSTIRAVGVTVNNATKETNYNGTWPVFAIKQ